MQTKKSKRLYHITLLYENNLTRTVTIRATTRELAERKALKFYRGAKGVKHDA